MKNKENARKTEYVGIMRMENGLIWKINYTHV